MLICDNCNWQGEPEELVSATDDITDRCFNRCPRCDGTEFDEEIEEENER